MPRIRLKHYALSLICLLFPQFSNAQHGVPNPARQKNWFVRSGDYRYVASRVGLLRYDLHTEEWRTFTTSDGLISNQILEIAFDQGLLWLGSNNGVGNSDVRFNDWRNYDIVSGLTSNRYRAFAFDVDYVWAATDSGVARYDRYLEEWLAYTKSDNLPSGLVNDVFVAEDFVWIATDSGVGRYDKKYETWLVYTPEDGLVSFFVYWIREVGEEIWFFTDKGISRLTPSTQTWRSITATDGLISPIIWDIESDGDMLWLVTDKGVVQCDWRSGNCLPFLQQTNLGEAQVRDISIAGNQIWFATDRGLFRFLKNITTSSSGQGGEEWLRITMAKGLQTDDLRRCEADGNQIFILTTTGIDIFRQSSSDVLSFQFGETGFGGVVATGAPENLKVRIDDSGLVIGSGTTFSSKLNGIYSYTSQTSRHDVLHSDNNTSSYSRHRAQLYENVALSKDRSINAFYDNTYIEDVLYGAAFRGNLNDNVREARCGNRIQPDLVNTELIGKTYLEGAMVRLEGGEKTLVKKRRRVRSDAYFGVREARYAQEIFYGRGDVLYHLKHADVLIGSAAVFVDGIELNVDEYNLDHTNGLLLFIYPGKELISSETKIEVIYQYRPHQDMGKQKIGIAQGVVSFGDDAFLGMSFLRDQQSDISPQSAALNVANAVGEVWLKSDDQNRELRVRPELAVSQDDSTAQRGLASRVEVLSRFSALQIRGNFQEYDDTFQTIGRRRTEFGELMGLREINTRYEPHKWLPFEAGWKREIARYGAENTGWARLSIAPPHYPAFSLSATEAKAHSPAFSRMRKDVRFGMEYELPQSLASRISMNRAFLFYQFRRITTDLNAAASSNGVGRVKSNNGFLRLKLSPNRKLTVNADLRIRNRFQADAQQQFLPLDRDNYVLINATAINLMPGISAFSRILGRTVEHQFNQENDTKDLYYDNRSDVNAELLPGLWWSGLNWLVLNSSYGISSRDSLRNVDEDRNWFETWTHETETSAGIYYVSSETKMLKATIYPTSRLILTEAITSNSSKNEVLVRILTSKVEFEPTVRSRLVVQHQQTNVWDPRLGFGDRRQYRPFGYWEQQWSNQLHTRLRIVYDRQVDDFLVTTDFTPSFYYLFKIRKTRYFGDIDFRNDLSFTRQRRKGSVNDFVYRYASSFRLDWRLTRNFILRFDSRISYLNDRLERNNDTLSLESYVRFSVRL